MGLATPAEEADTFRRKKMPDTDVGVSGVANSQTPHFEFSFLQLK
jgi:hypothetical protein